MYSREALGRQPPAPPRQHRLSRRLFERLTYKRRVDLLQHAAGEALEATCGGAVAEVDPAGAFLLFVCTNASSAKDSVMVWVWDDLDRLHLFFLSQSYPGIQLVLEHACFSTWN